MHSTHYQCEHKLGNRMRSVIHVIGSVLYRVWGVLAKYLTLIGCSSLLANTTALAAHWPQIAQHGRWQVRRGFYLGAEFGSSSVNYKTSLWTAKQAATIQSIKTSGFSEHITAGLIVSPYLATELTVNYIQKPQVTFKNNTKKHFKNNVIALMLRANLPITNQLYIMSKLGFGYVAREGLNGVNGEHLLDDNEYFRPVYSLGVDWRLTPHWDATASWQQAAGMQHVKLPATNFFGAGFYYRWK